MVPARVRFFLPVYPPLPNRRTWSDVAYEYLGALVEAAIPVLCLAINWSGDIGGGIGGRTTRWFRHRDLFFGGLDDKYVNLVCGVNEIQTRNLNYGPTRLPDGEILGDTEAVITSEPDLVRLFTVGVPNVAIVGGWPRPLVENEKKALQDYSAVICPTQKDFEAVNSNGGPNIHVITPGDSEALGKLLRSLL